MISESDPNISYGGDFELSLDYPTVGNFILKFLKLGEERDSLINGESGEIWTFKKILDESVKMAKVLYDAGIRQNDVVSIISENRNEFVSVAYGTLFLNAILAPINYTYIERELTHSLNISKPKFVFVTSLISRNVVPALQKMSYVKRIILFDEEKFTESKVITFEAFLKNHEKGRFDVATFLAKPVKITETALIFMSSGTTGLPKGVELSHKNLIAVVTINHERIPIGREIFGVYRTLSITPWFHTMGFMSMLFAVTSMEFPMVYLWKFEPELYLKSIEKYKILTISVPPPVVVFLAKTPLFNKYDLSSLKVLISGAAALSKEMEDQVIARFNGDLIVLQGYGQTEATLGVLYGMVGSSKPGSVGSPIKSTFAKVIDDKGNSLGPNKVGELCFKGALIMKGYLGNDGATREVIDKDGWLHSGDLGYYDEDLQFFIVDRLKELIKFNGFQVAPAELEALLLTHPKVKDCGVIGIADENAGELPMAFVVKQPNEILSESEIKGFIEKNASNAKWLRGGVKFIEEIPKNPSGKILRRELRDLYKSMKAKL